MPSQSGIYHEDYASDMQLRPTTMQRIRQIAIVAAVLLMPFILGSNELRIVNQVLIAAVGAVGLNILTGYTGQISLGQGAFLAIGAYGCGLMMAFFNVPWPIALLLGASITAIIGGFFGLPSLRLKGLYLAVATLSAQVIVEWVIKRWDPIDGELDGRTTDALNIPSNLLVNWQWVDANRWLATVGIVILIGAVLWVTWRLQSNFQRDRFMAYRYLLYVVVGLIVVFLSGLIVILQTPMLSLQDVFTEDWRLNGNEYAFYCFAMPVTILVIMAATNLFRTHIGRAFIAIRDQDIAAEVMGVNIFRYKVLSFMVSSFIVGLAGGMLALHSTAISFERFTIEVSIEYLAMIIIGGLGSVSGSVYGAAFIVILPELLRTLGRTIAGTDPASLSQFNRILPFAQQGVFGAAILITLIVESGGIRKIWQNTKDYFRLWPFEY
ncbi:MAG: branched-chain amino acid ABC transporter permease [Anaerolineae bacterium]|nr:branched-chain amino acid ABC transporter permease [Anaerolineae bacterium]